MAERILSVEEMREWEARTWAAGVAQEDVIRAAGRAVASVVRRRSKVGAPVLVLAGRGHNGDDAAVAAGELEIVLEAYESAPLPIQVVFQKSGRVPAKINTFVDFLTHRLGQDAALNPAIKRRS